MENIILMNINKVDKERNFRKIIFKYIHKLIQDKYVHELIWWKLPDAYEYPHTLIYTHACMQKLIIIMQD